MPVSETIEVIHTELNVTLYELFGWFDKDKQVLIFKPINSWSIEQILEHITLTNQFLLILIRKGKDKALQIALKKEHLEKELEAYEYNLKELDDIAVYKSFTWIRPEHMEPIGDQSMIEVKAKLKGQIEECLNILNDLQHGEGILYKTMMSVNNLGKIDVYQYIYFLCQHAKRHLAQMQRVEKEYSRFKGAE